LSRSASDPLVVNGIMTKSGTVLTIRGTESALPDTNPRGGADTLLNEAKVLKHEGHSSMMTS
jgi:hypothetical protein